MFTQTHTHTKVFIIFFVSGEEEEKNPRPNREYVDSLIIDYMRVEGNKSDNKGVCVRFITYWQAIILII